MMGSLPFQTFLIFINDPLNYWALATESVAKFTKWYQAIPGAYSALTLSYGAIAFPHLELSKQSRYWIKYTDSSKSLIKSEGWKTIDITRISKDQICLISKIRI